MTYGIKKRKSKEISVYSFKKNPDKAKVGDKIFMVTEADETIGKDEFKIDEKYKLGDNIYFEDYKDEGVIVYNKKTKKWS
jgi:hypothetical protein